jgi:hypothetical protein
MRTPSWAVLVSGLTAGLWGCSDAPTKKVDTSSIASAAKDPAMGGKIDEVAKKLDTKASASPSAAANQPPPNGIFPKGAADVAHPANAPPKLELVGEGENPKIQLHASPAPEPQILPVRVSLKLGQESLPPLDVTLHLGPPGSLPAAPLDSKPGKDPKAASSVAASSASATPATPPPAPGADRPMTVTILGVSVAGANAADIPKQLQTILDVMKGGTIDFTMTKTGPSRFSRRFATAPEAGALQLLDLEFGAIEDTLTAMYTPAPPKPVGQGAFWMVTDRRASYGSDVVRYRLFRVVQIEGSTATLSIEQRQYAADDKSALLPPDTVLATYAVDAKGVTQVTPNAVWPMQGLLQQRIVSQVLPAGAEPNPNLMREFRIEVNVQLGMEAKPGDAPQPAGPAPKPKR